MHELTAIGQALESENITYKALKDAVRLDSFIREVLRTKGDTLNAVRRATCNVPLGEYTIPKGISQA